MQASGYAQQALEYQADQIERVLAGHKIPIRVTGGVITPRWIRYQVWLGPTAKISRVAALSEEIALRLDATSVRIARQGAAVQIEVPRPDGQRVSLPQITKKLGGIPRQTAVLGLDESGLPLLLRLSSPEVAHVLIAGTTGSGKTALARSMALSLAMHNRLGDVQMLFIDPKRTGFASLAQPLPGCVLPHLLRPVVDDVHQAVFLLGEMVTEMVRRDRERITNPRLIIFIDEVADLMELGGKAMDRLMTRLTQRGRSAGLHLIACTQKPLAATIGSLTRSNFPVRLVGSVASADDARIAAGIPGTGAEKLLGRGDFILVAKGQVTRFQAAHTNTAETRQIVSRLQERWHTDSNRFAAAHAEPLRPLAASGTDGQPAVAAPSRRRRLTAMFGHQLKLIKS